MATSRQICSAVSGRAGRTGTEGRQKSQCRPSSREMSSLEKVRPCSRPRFFSQKMEQKLQQATSLSRAGGRY